MASCSINTSGGCNLQAQPAPGSTVYYAGTNAQPFQLYARSVGNCDVGSCAGVSLFSGVFPALTPIAGCGNLPLDGQWHLQSCPGTNRGSSAAGPYEFQTYVNVNYYAFNAFSVTHNQVTSTAATPTQTITVSTTQTSTTTTTSTQTDTTTLQQETVTSPAATDSRTVTITPDPTTITTTSTKVYTRTKYAFTGVKATTTYTAPCKTITPKTCPRREGKPRQQPPKKKQQQKPRNHARDLLDVATEGGAAPLEKRQNQGDSGVNGDGPLTTTVTPDPTTTTTTADGGTVTETDTAYDTQTVTVPPDPLTTTVYAGTTTNIATTTLPQVTSTVSKCTTSHTKTTKTKTYTIVKTVKTTPICPPKAQITRV